MESRRQQKVSGLIQKELGEIFQREGRSLTGNAFVTVTQVNISPDLGLAKIWLSLMMVDNREAFVENLNERKKELRKHLGNRVGKQLRIVPEIVFFLDASMDHVEKMDALFGKLDTPKTEENDSPEQATKED